MLTEGKEGDEDNTTPGKDDDAVAPGKGSFRAKQSAINMLMKHKMAAQGSRKPRNTLRGDVEIGNSIAELLDKELHEHLQPEQDPDEVDRVFNELIKAKILSPVKHKASSKNMPVEESSEVMSRNEVLQHENSEKLRELRSLNPKGD